MKRATFAPLALVLAGCASLPGRGPSDAQLRYDAGVEALSRRDFSVARSSLELASREGNDEIRLRSLFLLAAVQLDPENPGRDTELATDIAARLRSGAQPGSLEYVAAETLERAAREVSDLRQDLIAARSERDRAWNHIDSLRTRADSVEVQRDSVLRRAARLEMVGDSLEKELKKTTQELERIRRAIRG